MIEGLVLGCGNGHRFDANKRGYLNTLDRSAGIVGDTRAILDARAAFLATGAYSPIADALQAVVPRHPNLSILDSGCGTGYYLARLLTGREDAAALALDASADAVALSVAASGASGLVADVWRPLPVRDGVADVVLCVFAPRNIPEFARVLSRAGRLVVVTPQPKHLEQLRATGAVLGMRQNKLAHLDESMKPLLTLDDRNGLSFEITVDAAQAALLAGMGPAGHHERAAAYSGPVTVAVDISVYTKKAGS